MPPTKRKASKKQAKSSTGHKPGRKPRTPRPVDDFESFDEDVDLPEIDGCEINQYGDNISLYEEENMDLLDSIEGIEFEQEEFKKGYPHLAKEIIDPNLVYPVEAVRWHDEKSEPKEVEPDIPEEPTVESLIRRSKTEEEAVEIILYLEKRGEINSHEADRLINDIEKNGLEAFKARRGRKKSK